MTNPGDDMTRQLLITRLLAGMRLAGMLIAGTVWLNANCSFAQDAVPPLKLPNVNLPDGDSHYFNAASPINCGYLRASSKFGGSSFISTVAAPVPVEAA